MVTLGDLLARKLFAPTELPVGVLTAAVGAPYLIWLLVRTSGRTRGSRTRLSIRTNRSKKNSTQEPTTHRPKGAAQ